MLSSFAARKHCTTLRSISGVVSANICIDDEVCPSLFFQLFEMCNTFLLSVVAILGQSPAAGLAPT